MSTHSRSVFLCACFLYIHQITYDLSKNHSQSGNDEFKLHSCYAYQSHAIENSFEMVK